MQRAKTLQFAEKNKNMNNHTCHDCGNVLNSGDEFVRFEGALEGSDAIKCRECFNENPVLKNFQACDVYSRVVGFHTPVRRWNNGKAAEWNDRKTYEVNGSFQGACATC